MGFHVLDSPENAAGWLLAVILTPICILATVLRFVATRQGGRKLGWEDLWALLGLVFYIPYAVYLLMILSEANGRDLLAFVEDDPKNWVTLAKYGLMMNGLYGLQQTFVKYSLLALYYRIFWVKRSFVITVWAVAIAQGMWAVVVLLCHIFACVPVQKAWYSDLPGTCINMNLFFSVYEPINSAIDFIVAGLAIYMLSKIKVQRANMRWISILFALGSFSGILGIVKTVQAQDSAKRSYLSVIWNLVQMATSLICCCAPIYKSIMPEIKLSSIGSWALRTFGGSSRSNQTPKGDSGADAAGNRPRPGDMSSKLELKLPGGLDRNSHWMHLNSSSERELTRVEVQAVEPRERDEPEHSIPIKAVRVRQSFEVS